MGQPVCHSMTPLGAGSWCVTQHVERNEVRQTMGREMWQRKQVERHSEAWESQRMAKKKVWALPSPGLSLCLLLLTASPKMLDMISDSNMLTAGPRGFRILSSVTAEQLWRPITGSVLCKCTEDFHSITSGIYSKHSSWSDIKSLPLHNLSGTTFTADPDELDSVLIKMNRSFITSSISPHLTWVFLWELLQRLSEDINVFEQRGNIKPTFRLAI